jgi:hypothetical protein
VHERSVDGDILCLLARRVLVQLPHIKVVLMSATVHTSLYRDYFDVREETIFVGVRRFPLREFYCEDLVEFLPPSQRDSLRKLAETTSECAGYQGEVVGDAIVKEQLNVAVNLTRQIAAEGIAVLIFVSGMADIQELMDKFDKSKRSTVKLKLIAIHSDIPFEEQMQAFQPAGRGEAKVVIATNAAESSLTLPDVDHVICLGTHKMLSYNDRHHAAQLTNCWVRNLDLVLVNREMLSSLELLERLFIFATVMILFTSTIIIGILCEVNTILLLSCLLSLISADLQGLGYPESRSNRSSQTGQRLPPVLVRPLLPPTGPRPERGAPAAPERSDPAAARHAR